tara:strand:- start:36 stop:1247 length:1212 start_codon:yes stop_codon:yes gene_type:complete
MDRLYSHLLKQHIEDFDQSVFLAGPRQVGKTTVSKTAKTLTGHFSYYNWDVTADRETLLDGQSRIIESVKQDARAKDDKPIIVLDEIHKMPDWKNYIKGIYDSTKGEAELIVTGSTHLDVYRKSQDSLMGRYFPYTVHPLSVAEILDTTLPKNEIRQPSKIDDEAFDALLEFGGFPEPFIKQSENFSRRWQKLRSEQLFREDIMDLTNIKNIAGLETLALLLRHQVGGVLNRSNLAKKLQVTVNTVQSWISTLEQFYHCFLITPWAKNVTRSLIKEPKPYLWDWSIIEDKGAGAENFIAAHLLKAVNFWNDTGMGDYSLHFLRDKDKREVDFVVTKDQKAWFLVEVKSSKKAKLSENLAYFQKQTGAKHAFQVTMDGEYIDRDVFDYEEPVIVPAKTFLSQLV